MADPSAGASAHAASARTPHQVLAADGGSIAPASSLRSNVAWTLAGNAVYAGCQWLILIVIARLSDPSAVGRFALGLATTAPVFLFAGLQLRGVQATDTARRFRFADYLRARAAGMAISLGVIGAFVACSGYDRDTAYVIGAVAFSKAAEGLSDVYYGLLQQNERMRPIALSLAMRGIVSVACVSAVLWSGGSLPLAVLALALGWLGVLLVHDIPVASRLPHRARDEGAEPPRVESGRVVQIIRISLPLGFVLMLLSLRTNIPRYFLEHQGGHAELGVYAAISSLVQAGSLVISALGQAATPRLARYRFEHRKRAFVRLLFKLLAIGATVGIVGIVIAAVGGASLLNVFFGSQYAEHADLFVWLAGAGLVAYCGSLLGYALTAARRFRIQLPLFALSSAASALGCLLLVPRYGLLAAAWSWGIALLIEVALAAAALAYDLKTSRRGVA